MPALRTTNTWEALDALRSRGLLAANGARCAAASYDFLRLVESRLRIVHNRSLDELPETPDDLEKLARRLGFEAGPDDPGRCFLAELERHTTQTRDIFLRIVERER